MDLHRVETYLRPHDFTTIKTWDAHHAWLAGGTWLFSEPQPHLHTLVDLEALNWQEIEPEPERIGIGATCSLTQLTSYPWPPSWQATRLFSQAVSALAASFKVTHLATIGGNLCLALAVGVMAPVCVLLDATYEIWKPGGDRRFVPARQFQVGHQQTALQTGEVLRRIWLPSTYLTWRTGFQRFGMTATDPALALVMVAQDPASGATRICLGACVAAPQLLEFGTHPGPADLTPALESIRWLDDLRASARYRHQITQVLITRALSALA